MLVSTIGGSNAMDVRGSCGECSAVKIALVGKGGSGKTTLAALLVRRLIADRHPVLGLDADIDHPLAVPLRLNHLVDVPGEYVVVDMPAGADSFASGLFTRFDMTFVVCEPTLRSVGVYRQYLEYAKDFGVRLAVVGNKVCDDEDADFLREE